MPALTPKHYARISRLGRVLQGGEGAWSGVALEAGFHDQSHLIRDFRDLLGLTPEQFRKRLAPY